MPTILHEQGFRFAFYAADRREPPHIHVFKGGAEAKWWLRPPREAWSAGYNLRDRRTIARIIRDHHRDLLAAWNEAFPEV